MNGEKGLVHEFLFFLVNRNVFLNSKLDNTNKTTSKQIEMITDCTLLYFVLN